MCPTMELFMRGTFSVRAPLKAKALPTWSFDGVLQYLKSEVFEPLEVVDDSNLIDKTLPDPHVLREKDQRNYQSFH